MRRFLLVLALVLTPFAAAFAEADMETVIPRFRTMIQEAMKASGVPGVSVAVVYQGKLVMLEGYGVTNVDAPTPVTADTIFQLASCSKPVATTAVAALVGEGKLDWDTRIVELDPSFQLADPWVTQHITVRDMLCHRSGLPGQAGNELEELGFDQRAILARLRYVDLGNRFRSKYSYSNFGITQGCVAATRGRFAETCDEKVFRPLGMTRSSARYSDFEKATDKAEAHVLEDGKAVQRYRRTPDAQAPAGGVSSTARDLSQFMLLHLGHGPQVVQPEALLATHEPLMLTGFNTATFSSGWYGLGWATAVNRWGMMQVKHSGAFSTGSRSQILLVPEADFGVAILCNAFPSGLPEGLSGALESMVLGGTGDLQQVLDVERKVGAAMAGMVGGGLGARPASAQPPGQASRYEGEYRSDYFGAVRVQGMQLSLGPDRRHTGTLKPWDGDTLLLDVELPDGPLQSLAEFTVGPDGRATRLRLVQLDDFGTATFTRDR